MRRDLIMLIPTLKHFTREDEKENKARCWPGSPAALASSPPVRALRRCWAAASLNLP